MRISDWSSDVCSSDLVKFGGEEVGGIRISHLSDIDKDIAIALTATRGRKEKTRIQRLDEAGTVTGSRKRLEAAARGGMASLRSTWTSIPADHKRAIGGDQGCPDEFKTIAQAADARSTPGDDVDPDTGEAVQPMQSDTPAAPEPLGDDADE